MRKDSTKLTKQTVQKILISKGVPLDHIKKMQRTRNQSEEPFCWYCDEGEEWEDQLVEVSKIKGLGYRGTIGRSWFSHACWNHSSNMDFGRCWRALDILNKQSLEEFHTYYQENPVRLIYYEEEDTYFVHWDGTHRTLFAKLTGSKTIKAHVVQMRRNTKKYKAFLVYRRTVKGIFHLMFIKLFGKAPRSQ